MAARLNEDGIRTLYGGKWSNTQVRKIATNPAYRGALAWNKKTMGKLHGVGGDGKVRPRRGNYITKKNPKADWFVVEDVHEPLVPVELFEQVQKVLDSRKHMGGRAKTGNRSLLSGLIVCTRCGWHFGQWRNTTYNRKREKRRRYRYYIDRGYYTGGKAVCKHTHIPAGALDAWVIDLVKRTLLGDNETTAEAVDAFVRQVMAGQDKPTDTTGVEKDLGAVAKRIKAVVGMLSDPSFEGMEELKTTLADLKVKRDALQKRLEKARPTSSPIKESNLRAWATARLDELDRILTGQASTVEARDLVHSVVDRIEVDPLEERGTLYIPQDAYAVFMRSFSTMGTLQDAMFQAVTAGTWPDGQQPDGSCPSRCTVCRP